MDFYAVILLLNIVVAKQMGTSGHIDLEKYSVTSSYGRQRTA